MIPILYDSSEKAFTSNGLGRLRDCITCTCTEERNGLYEVNFSYPVTGTNYERIKLGRIIAVEHDDTDDVQPFEIVSCSKPIDGVVEFHAVHISYRQRFMTVSATNINSLADAFETLKQAEPSNPFTYWTDKTSTGYVASFDGVPRTVRSILGGVEGSILDAYGGEYSWDKWTVNLHAQRGTARNLTIRYGVNMLNYDEDLDYSSSYTACIPYWKSGGDTVVKGSMVSSGQNPYNGIESCVPLDLTDKFNAQPTATDLEVMARSVMNTKQPYMPAQSIKVDFVRIQDSNEYSHLAPLMNCRLCDTVSVVMPMYGTTGRFKIVKTEYNVLLEKYDSMELGTLSTSLSEALGITNSLGSGGSGGGGGGGSSDAKVLWSGAYYMTTAHTANLSEKISDQNNGIILVWSMYSGGAVDAGWQFQYIPKWFAKTSALLGTPVYFLGAANPSAGNIIVKKLLTVNDQSIVGRTNDNQASGTGYNNAFLVLRYVLGV